MDMRTEVRRRRTVDHLRINHMTRLFGNVYRTNLTLRRYRRRYLDRRDRPDHRQQDTCKVVEGRRGSTSTWIRTCNTRRCHRPPPPLHTRPLIPISKRKGDRRRQDKRRQRDITPNQGDHHLRERRIRMNGGATRLTGRRRPRPGRMVTQGYIRRRCYPRPRARRLPRLRVNRRVVIVDRR